MILLFGMKTRGFFVCQCLYLDYGWVRLAWMHIYLCFEFLHMCSALAHSFVHQMLQNLQHKNVAKSHKLMLHMNCLKPLNRFLHCIMHILSYFSLWADIRRIFLGNGDFPRLINVPSVLTYFWTSKRCQYWNYEQWNLDFTFLRLEFS